MTSRMLATGLKHSSVIWPIFSPFDPAAEAHTPAHVDHDRRDVVEVRAFLAAGKEPKRLDLWPRQTNNRLPGEVPIISNLPAGFGQNDRGTTA